MRTIKNLIFGGLLAVCFVLGITSPGEPSFYGIQTYGIQTIGGHFLTAVDGGNKVLAAIQSNRTGVGLWEQFDLNFLSDGRVAIITHSGNYLTAVGGGGRLSDVLHTDADKIGNWEKFNLIDLGNGYFAFQTYNGNYLTPPVSATRSPECRCPGACRRDSRR